MTKRFVHVAAGVLIRPNGEFLLASRPEGKPMAGYWEFPGGKIEAGETPAHALVRELHEELGIEVKTAYPWVVQSFDYTHARVRLHFFRIYEWTGEIVSKEAQQFAWQQVGLVNVEPVLPANQDILRWLGYPVEITVRDGSVEELKAVAVSDVGQIRRVVQEGAELLYWTGETLPAEKGESALTEHALLPLYLPATLVANDITLAMRLGAHGIYHLG